MENRKKIAVGAVVLAGALVAVLAVAYSSKSSADANDTKAKEARTEKTDRAADARFNDLFEKLHQQVTEFDKTFDSFFDDAFFAKATDPLKDMDQLRNTLRNEFGKLDLAKDEDFSDHIFDAWFNHRFGGNYGDIKRKEDKKYVYYQFKVDNPKSYKFTTKVHDGFVELSADHKTVTKEDKKGYSSKTVTESKLERSFPLPKNVNAEKFKTAIKGNQYIVKFPKST